MNQSDSSAIKNAAQEACIGRSGPIDALTNEPALALGALLNRERASRLMKQAGLDALVVTSPLNVYYVTNGSPIIGRFTHLHMTAAVLPADMSRSIAYIGSGFEYYAGVVDSGLSADVEPYLTGGFLGNPDPCARPEFPVAGDYPFDARERRRRSLVAKLSPFHDGMRSALAKALGDRSLRHAVIGVDCADAGVLVQAVAPASSCRPADDLMLHVRLVKTPAEMLLMRRASEINVEASLIAANAAREEGSTQRIRQRFFAEAARLGGVGVYGSVDLMIGELTDGVLREGQAFMVDFVSHYGFYQGDYGRTVFLGEPDVHIRRAAEVGLLAWREIRERLKPGLRFSEIRHIGFEAVRKSGVPFTYGFQPHIVGLQHWDQPRMTIDGKPLDLELEEGMVLSVDCPLLSVGVNGTSHFEDLVCITAGGSEPIHEIGNEMILV